MRHFVISVTMAVICRGSVPGGREAEGAAEGTDDGWAVARVVTGVFSLFVSWEEVVLDGPAGDEGSGGRKFSVSSESDEAPAGRGIEEGMTMFDDIESNCGMGNSSCAIYCRGVSQPCMHMPTFGVISDLFNARDYPRQQGWPVGADPC